ncbi:Cro/CI family transcriptional regulator [Pseudomonas syringae]|uniref:Cro/CI family transcriptional regulator n=1 Tax=Pseudomonas syringae TaxID=317 RepID=UPI000A88C632|nr:Cro/CI family transcriptional regulator [Pseudomonas syringae]
MTTNKAKPAKSIPDLAEEASFQLGVARDYLNWIGAVARAMALNTTHGKDNFELVTLCQFLSDTALPGIESSIGEFDALIAGGDESAPRNDDIKNVARLSLKEFSKGRQHAAAKQLGVQQAAISKALRVGRNIFVSLRDDGSVTAVEEKVFPGPQGGEASQ